MFLTRQAIRSSQTNGSQYAFFLEELSTNLSQGFLLVPHLTRARG